jgi:hypothetical protein
LDVNARYDELRLNFRLANTVGAPGLRTGRALRRVKEGSKDTRATEGIRNNNTDAEAL